MVIKMIDQRNICRYLKEYISRGIDKFVIYPFGLNGINVRNILADYFDVMPVMIVDNEYSKFNAKIIDAEALKEKYDNDAYVILTVEDKELNDVLLNDLQKFVPVDHILNMYDLKSETADLHNFYIGNFLPGLENKKKDQIFVGVVGEKIKVRFLHSSESTWNTIKTICQAFQKDERFDVLMILGCGIENIHDTFVRLQKYGLQSIHWEQYKAEEDLPDIMVLNHPDDTGTQIKNCRECCKLIVVASMELIRYVENMRIFWRCQEKGFKRFEPDYYLFDTLLYNELLQSDYASEPIVEIGNAQYDIVYEASLKKQYRDGWEKLRNKKVILWTTDHGIYGEHVSKELTFDLYASVIFRYMKENPKMGFIFRPHRIFISELLRNDLWSEHDLASLKQYCRESPNIVFDDSITYNNAFSVADGILTDAFCGITGAALPTLKPVCMTYRRKTDLPCHMELNECYYSAYSADDILTFFELVKNEGDSMFHMRKEASEKYVKHFDGNNGQRIKEFIYDKFLDLRNNFNVK